MAAEGGAIITFVFNGEDSEDIPRDVTHLIVHENITVIPRRLFYNHPNLVEVYCHAGVIKIEKYAFGQCRCLRRVSIPGVIIIEEYAFNRCRNLVYVDCDKLERIGPCTFEYCLVLSGINLPSAKIVDTGAFRNCRAMTQAIFGKDLESIHGQVFMECRSLESITIPLGNDLFLYGCGNLFTGCVNLKRVGLVEDELLRDIANALLRDDWKNDMNKVLDSINEVLPNADCAYVSYANAGGKANEIREWVGNVLLKVTYYRAAHRELLNEAATLLQLSLPNDLLMDNVLPFVELPAHAFDGEDEEE